MYGRKVWSVNIKDVEWLPVELADDSEEITNLKHGIDEFEKDPNTNPERLVTLKSKGNRDCSRYHQNNMKSLSQSHQLAYATSKKHSDVT